MADEDSIENHQTSTLYLCELDPETRALKACLGTLISDARGYKFRPWSAARAPSRKWHAEMLDAIPRDLRSDARFTRLLSKAEMAQAEALRIENDDAAPSRPEMR